MMHFYLNILKIIDSIFLFSQAWTLLFRMKSNEPSTYYIGALNTSCMFFLYPVTVIDLYVSSRDIQRWSILSPALSHHALVFWPFTPLHRLPPCILISFLLTAEKIQHRTRAHTHTHCCINVLHAYTPIHILNRKWLLFRLEWVHSAHVD